jgi:DNA helicase-2/ATP-dependent DNA helicase PcrA
VENLLTFADRYPKVSSVGITTNFRSSKVIVDTARAFIEHNFDRLPKKIEAWEDGGIAFEPGDIYSVQFNTFREELEFIIRRIKDLRGTKYVNNKGEEYALDYRDMAVFFRSVKYSADDYITAFKEHGIPFVVKGGGKLFEQEEVILATQALGYLGGYNYHNSNVTPASMKKLYLRAFGKKREEYAEKFVRRLERLKEDLAQEDTISLQGLFHTILGMLGAQEFEFTETQLYNLGMLSQAITDFEAVYKRIKVRQLKYFLGFIGGYAKWNYEEGGSDDPTKVNAVKIMTVHRAKGLQFPVVFVPHLVEGLFPTRPRASDWLLPEELFDKERYEGKLEDERRLFYVAVTRSEKFLYLTSYKRKANTRYNTAKASRFLREYPTDYAITQPIADPTAREKIDLKHAAPLKRFATSYSDLRYYDRCPYDYRLRFIYGFNPEISIALGYGRSIHNILNIIHTDHRRDPPDEKETEKIVEENFFLRYCTQEFIDRFKNSAKRIINNYVQRYAKEFNLILETEKAFEFALDRALISGQIDLIKKLNDKGELEALEIVDFKEHDNTELSTDYVKQLRLYAIASIKSLGFRPKKATVHHLDEGTVSEVDITETALMKVEENVKETIDNIMTRVFPRKAKKNKCKECDWKELCVKKLQI